MAKLVIHQENITPEAAEKLAALCPFSAIYTENGRLVIDAGCKMCKLCVKSGPDGAITLEENEYAPDGVITERNGEKDVTVLIDKDAWRGVAVYAECAGGKLHNVSKELLGKARELAGVTGQPVYALLAGYGVGSAARELLRYGADEVFVVDDAKLEHFLIGPYANVFEDFIRQVRPSSILVGATQIGRSLAPRVAARFRTGLTADCTALEMKPNSDLIQIRPAFGGNIMAEIVTSAHRPQLCTVRYKVFSAPAPVENPAGVIRRLEIPAKRLDSSVEILSVEEKPKQLDISEAKVIVAVGRGLKKREELAMAGELAELLGAQLACTRPLIESGWMDPRRQIGLSGRTVGAELIVTLGVSGSVQFAAGMRGCGCIIAVNSDPSAAIFGIAHYAVVGDLYEILPRLIAEAREAKAHAV